MAAIAVELKIECRYCGKSIPINALSPKFLCRECLSEIEISKNSWREFLGEICRRVLKENENRLNITGNIIPFYVEGHQAFRLYGKEEPKFKNNFIPIPENLNNIKNDELIFQEEKISIREVPKEYTSFLKGVRYLIGEEKNQIPYSKNLIHKENSELIVFTCPNCGGGLKINGDNRIIDCNFCDSHVYIPDALWFRFHPSIRTKRWYLYFGDSFPNY